MVERLTAQVRADYGHLHRVPTWSRHAVLAQRLPGSPQRQSCRPMETRPEVCQHEVAACLLDECDAGW